MDVIGFIEKDVARTQRRSGVASALAALGVFLLPAAAGLLLREDWNGVSDLHIVIPNLVASLLLAGTALWVLAQNRIPSSAMQLGLLLLCLTLFFAMDRVFFPAGLRTEYSTSLQFWQESGRCFKKGFFTTLALGAWVSYFAYRYAALPTRRKRALFCVVAGVAGAVMLGFHCDSSSAAHVGVGHVAQGFLAGGLVFAAQNLFFRSALRQGLPELETKVAAMGKLG